MTREQLIMDTFVELADTLAGDFDIGDFLQMLVERCAAVLQVQTGGVLIEGPDGTLQLAAATSETMKELEDLEMELKQGPCLEAYQEVAQVLAADLREEKDRWPQMAPKAIEMDLLAVYAFPLRLRGDCIGALNLYRSSTGEFEDDDVRLAQAFADVAAIGILQERKVSDAERRSQQLQEALVTRIVIEQAKGIVAERHNLTAQLAFDALRRHARSRHQKLRDVCRGVVEGGQDLPL